MDSLIVSKDKFEKVLDDFEVLIKDVAYNLNQDEIAKKKDFGHQKGTHY